MKVAEFLSVAAAQQAAASALVDLALWAPAIHCAYFATIHLAKVVHGSGGRWLVKSLFQGLELGDVWPQRLLELRLLREKADARFGSVGESEARSALATAQELDALVRARLAS